MQHSDEMGPQGAVAAPSGTLSRPGRGLNPDAVLMVVLFVAAFVTYFQTFFSAGFSAGLNSLTDSVSGAAAAGKSGHPVWGLITRVVASLPGHPAWPARFLSAVFGGLSVVCVYRIVQSFLTVLLRPQSDMRLMPELERDEQLEAAAGVEKRRTADIALGAAAGALTFAFSAPFWLASTLLSARLVEALFLLSVVVLLLFLFTSERQDVGFAAFFLCGAGIVESPSLIVLLPVAFAIVIRVMIRSDTCSESVPPLLIIAFLAGAALNLGLWFMQTSSALDGLGQARLFLHVFEANLGRDLFSAGFFFGWFVPALALFFSLICVRHIVLSDRELGMGGWVLVVLITGVSFCSLANKPDAFNEFFRSDLWPPVISSFMMALVVGCAFSSWARIANVLNVCALQEEDNPPGILKGVGFVAIGALAFFLLKSSVVNFADLQEHRKGTDASMSGEARSPVATKAAGTVSKQRKKTASLVKNSPVSPEKSEPPRDVGFSQ